MVNDIAYEEKEVINSEVKYKTEDGYITEEHVFSIETKEVEEEVRKVDRSALLKGLNELELKNIQSQQNHTTVGPDHIWPTEHEYEQNNNNDNNNNNDTNVETRFIASEHNQNQNFVKKTWKEIQNYSQRVQEAKNAYDKALHEHGEKTLKSMVRRSYSRQSTNWNYNFYVKPLKEAYMNLVKNRWELVEEKVKNIVLPSLENQILHTAGENVLKPQHEVFDASSSGNLLSSILVDNNEVENYQDRQERLEQEVKEINHASDLYF